MSSKARVNKVYHCKIIIILLVFNLAIINIEPVATCCMFMWRYAQHNMYCQAVYACTYLLWCNFASEQDAKHILCFASCSERQYNNRHLRVDTEQHNRGNCFAGNKSQASFKILAPGTFWLQAKHSNHQAILTPRIYYEIHFIRIYTIRLAFRHICIYNI